MKVIVKNLLNGKYLAVTGAWTEDQDSARQFDNSSEAYLFCATHALHHAELAFGPQRQTSLPFFAGRNSCDYPLDD